MCDAAMCLFHDVTFDRLRAVFSLRGPAVSVCTNYDLRLKALWNVGTFVFGKVSASLKRGNRFLKSGQFYKVRTFLENFSVCGWSTGVCVIDSFVHVVLQKQ